MNIIHRDLKPENILISNGVFKIADFTFAKTVDDFKSQLLTSMVGTPLYMSPQILMTKNYTYKSDIFSLGVIMYEMIFGKTPWPARSQYELIQNIQNFPVTFHYSVVISDELKVFLKGCLQFNENDRFSWDNIFSHKFVTNSENNKEELNEKEIKKDYMMQEMDKKAITIIQKLQHIIISQKVNIVQLFEKLDTSGNYNLEIEEFTKLIKIIDNSVREEEIEHIFKKFDINGDHEISLDEFRTLIIETDYSQYTANKDPFLEQKAENVFEQIRNAIKKTNLDITELINIFDKSDSGELTFSTFNKLINNVAPTVSPKEIEYIFKKLDEDDSGTIDTDELTKALKLENIFNKKAMMMKLKTKHFADKNLDDKISRILQELRYIIIMNNLNLQKIFDNFNENGTGKLTQKEFAQIIRIIDEKITDEEMKYLFKKFDMDGDEAISYVEFEKCLG